MLASLRRSYADLITSGAQLLLLLAGFHLASRTGWLISLTLMAAISMFAWLSALKRLRAIRDTPTSKVASAAQGYVELIGRGEQFGDTPLLSKLTLLPCLWYRYKVERRTSKDKWITEDSGESIDSFLLRDDSGVCVVDPEQAEIYTQHRDYWRKGDYRYTEWKLIQQDRIYVIGEFRTQSGSLEFDSRAELSALLTEWKRDMPTLLRRFDLNNDGKLDMDEWLLARQAAKREVAKNQRDALSLPDLHIIGRPRDGKLFLISNLTQEKLSRRYHLWAWAHLGIFFGALGGIGWTIQSGYF
ncbi:MAG: hypothetical protein WC208_03385 [Gallionella sp.]|jgi:hypothetical protein